MKITGSIIPADHVYKTVDNKWIVSGTYNTWATHESELYLPHGLCIYIRLITEHTGPLKGVLELRNALDDPRAESQPALKVDIQFNVTPDMVPIAEARLVLGGLRIPGPPLSERSAQRVDVAKMTLYLRLFDHTGELYDVSKAPMTIVFKAPIPSVDNHDTGPDGPGQHGPGE